jgi:3-oxoacyl-(acyl-carrier-protein) synthase
LSYHKNKNRKEIKMAITFVNKSITENSAQSVLSCVAVATIAAGLPVNIYIDSSGVRKCINSAISTSSKNYGITVAQIKTGEVGDVVVGGTATVASAGGTAGQVITAIAATSACTTGAITATNTVNSIGVKVATNSVILY